MLSVSSCLLLFSAMRLRAEFLFILFQNPDGKAYFSYKYKQKALTSNGDKAFYSDSEISFVRIFGVSAGHSLIPESFACHPIQ